MRSTRDNVYLPAREFKCAAFRALMSELMGSKAYLERRSRDESLPALIALVVVRRSSALRHLRAHDRLVVIVAVAVHQNPRDPLLPALLRARFRLRRLLPLVGLDRVAESADRVRQLGFRWRLRRISATLAGTRDNAAVVARGGRLRGRGADTLKEGWLAASRGRRDSIVGGCERDRRLIDLLDFRFRITADYLARRSQVIVEIRFATGNFESRGARPVTSRCAFRGMNGILRAHRYHRGSDRFYGQRLLVGFL